MSTTPSSRTPEAEPEMTVAARTPLSRPATLLLVVLAILTTVAVSPADAAPRARSGAEQHAEDVVLTLHGEARANPGRFGYAADPVPALTPWTDIRDVARSWADRQASERRMFHNPDFASQLCCWTAVGENVAYITLRSLDNAAVESASRAIFQAWMDSDSHRRNILSAAYDQMGLGVSITSTSTGYAMYLTANFREVSGTAPGSRYGVSSASTASSAPAPAPYDTPACPEGEFERGVFDDTLSGTHAGAIDCMAWWGIVARTDARDGVVFGQHDVATRGFMAAVITRLAAEGGAPLPAPSRDHFDDDDGHRYEHAINRVVTAGIADGFTDGTFRPDASLTRAQMATFLARTYRDWLRLGSPDTSDHFDDDRRNVHEDNINLVAEVDIARGTDVRRFSPGRTLSRGQLASFAARTADHLVAAGVSPAGVS